MKRFARPARLMVGSDLLLGMGVFLFTTALYIHTAAPTLGGEVDSEEYQHVAYTLSVAHSSGYPLYLILGKLFITLVPIGNIAYRMNLLSTLMGGCAAVVVFLITLKLTRRQVASLAATALFATNASVWRESGVASAGPLNLLLLGLVLYTLLLWDEGKVPLAVPAFVFGLGLAHHRSILFLAPAIAVFVLLSHPEVLRRPRQMAQSILWLVLPLLLYLYIPIAGLNSPWYTNTVSGFMVEVFGNEAGHLVGPTASDFASAIFSLAVYLDNAYGYLGLLLVIVGAASLASRFGEWDTPLRKTPVRLLLGLAALSYLVFAILVMGETDRYFVLPFFFFIFFFAIGAGALERQILDRIKTTRAQSAAHAFVAILLVLFVGLPFGDRYAYSDWSSYDREYKQWDEIFTLPLPLGAMIVGNWGQLNAIRYLQRIENRRPDLQSVGTLYDPGPQTEAARNAFADGRAIYLAPGVALPIGSYHYSQLGPLLEVREAPQLEPPAISARSIPFNTTLTLYSFQATTALEPYVPLIDIAPGRTVRATLVWRAVGQQPFLVRLRLYDPEARLIAQSVEPPVRGVYPPQQWQSGEYVSDVHNIQIPVGTPPGAYRLSGQTVDASSAPLSGEFDLASFAVDSSVDPARAQVFVAHQLDAAFGPHVELWGYGGFEGTRHAGDKFGIYLVWHVRDMIGRDLPLEISLVGPDGQSAADWQRPPIAFYPTHEWQKGEALKAYYDLQIPAHTAPGAISLRLTLDGSSLSLGSMQVAP